MQDQINQVYDAHLRLRKSIGKKSTKLTDKKKLQIEIILKEYHCEFIILLMDYLRLGEDFYARFIRGENKRKKDYTSLSNIFRPTKLDDKIEKAIAWKAELDFDNQEIYHPFCVAGGEND